MISYFDCIVLGGDMFDLNIVILLLIDFDIEIVELDYCLFEYLDCCVFVSALDDKLYLLD